MAGYLDAEGGVSDWGQHGDAIKHRRYSVRFPPRPQKRRRCSCGCGQPQTHMGMANGVGLVSGCELAIRRWVRTGHTMFPKRISGTSTPTDPPIHPPSSGSKSEVI